MAKTELQKEITAFNKRKKKEAIINREWYQLNSLLGNSWALFYLLLGGREAGKSYAVTECYVNQWKRYHRPFYWLRLTEASQRKLLVNNAEKLVDPDLRRKYNLDLTTKGDAVYEVTRRDKNGKITEKRMMARVLALSTFYNDKGSGLFDKDFLNDPNMYYNICLDEMNREANEKNGFDILYAFTNQLENLVRSTKQRLRIICIGNTLDEAGDILAAFNFQPIQFGRYKLVKNKKLLVQYLKELDAANTDKEKAIINKKYKDIDFGKRAIVEYMEPTSAYMNRRKGTIADILSPESSTFTNKNELDVTLVTKQRLLKPNCIIQFTKTDKYTIWDDNIIARYNGEKCEQKIAMRPYIDLQFYPELRDTVIERFDIRGFKFHNLATQINFKKSMRLLKPRKNG